MPCVINFGSNFSLWFDDSPFAPVRLLQLTTWSTKNQPTSCKLIGGQRRTGTEQACGQHWTGSFPISVSQIIASFDRRFCSFSDRRPYLGCLSASWSSVCPISRLYDLLHNFFVLILFCMPVSVSIRWFIRVLLTSSLVSWCFKPSQQQRITSGLIVLIVKKKF